jgi:glucokinase
MYLGIEIGGTKLQIGLGAGDGALLGLWRGTVDVAAAGEGIRKQILAAIPELLDSAKITSDQLRGVGIGFGGPVDDNTQRIIKSHQIPGWDNFPLPQWLSEALKLPCILGNDADVAGLAEARHGAGKGLSPIFYMTIGSGIGGGFIIDGQIYRAIGRGAAEIGHLRIADPRRGADDPINTLESIASGWGIGKYAQMLLREGDGMDSLLLELAGGQIEGVTAYLVGEAAKKEDWFAKSILLESLTGLAEAICAVIVLLCPKRIVIGGGVSLIGEEWFFRPLREFVAERVFAPFAGLTDIVPASLGEAVVVHGALTLARAHLGR